LQKDYLIKFLQLYQRAEPVLPSPAWIWINLGLTGACDTLNRLAIRCLGGDVFLPHAECAAHRGSAEHGLINLGKALSKVRFDSSRWLDMNIESGSEIELPVITIGPGQRSLSTELRELWSYRELLYFLVWRDVKVRYRQTLLGIAWAVLQPLLTMLLFTLFFGKLARMPSEGVPYALFAYVGLLPWIFFANAISEGGNSLVRNPDLISKVYIPRVMLPGAAVLAGLLDFGIGFVFLAALMAYYRVGITPAVLMLPGLILLTSLLAQGVGMWMAALNVKYRDVRYALPFVVQLWLFASPVIYPLTLVPERLRLLLLLNPMTGIIEGYHSSLLRQPFDWIALGVSTALTVLVLLFATRNYRRVEGYFADLI